MSRSIPASHEQAKLLNAHRRAAVANKRLSTASASNRDEYNPARVKTIVRWCWSPSFVANRHLILFRRRRLWDSIKKSPGLHKSQIETLNSST
jgi:hypothetical protein